MIHKLIIITLFAMLVLGNTTTQSETYIESLHEAVNQGVQPCTTEQLAEFDAFLDLDEDGDGYTNRQIVTMMQEQVFENTNISIEEKFQMTNALTLMTIDFGSYYSWSNTPPCSYVAAVRFGLAYTANLLALQAQLEAEGHVHDLATHVLGVASGLSHLPNQIDWRLKDLEILLNNVPTE